MSQFALFSDGAAACVIAADPGDGGTARTDCPAVKASHPAGYELLSCATAQDTATLEWTNQISSDLAREVTDSLLAPPGLKIGDLAALLHANLFTPLLVMKERQAGLQPGAAVPGQHHQESGTASPPTR